MTDILEMILVDILSFYYEQTTWWEQSQQSGDSILKTIKTTDALSDFVSVQWTAWYMLT